MEVDKIGHGSRIHAIIKADTDVIGLIRVPNEEYLKYLRERIQSEIVIPVHTIQEALEQAGLNVIMEAKSDGNPSDSGNSQ